MDLNMYPPYYFGIKGLDPLIFEKKQGYVASINQLKLVRPIEHLE
jgi:hypothetical protein